MFNIIHIVFYHVFRLYEVLVLDPDDLIQLGGFGGFSKHETARLQLHFLLGEYSLVLLCLSRYSVIAKDRSAA